MSVTTLTYSPAYNGGANFTWSDVTFSSSDGGLTYVGSPTTLSEVVPGNTTLTNVTIGNIVTNIYNTFFQSQLSSIDIPNSVITIGDYSFLYCTLLSSVTIENSVTSIGEQAFLGCSSLASISIPNFVTSIGSLAFYDCSSLATVFITDSTAKVLNPLWSSPTDNPPGISDFYGAPNPVAFVADFGPITITNISPNSGTKDGGTVVTITGSNFTATTVVNFGVNSASSVTLVSDTTITCVTPAGSAGQVDVVVSNEDGRATFVNGFTYFSICFKEGSKILTNKGYIVVQDLRTGDLVKTVSSGFKKIQHIGYSKMYHNVNEVRSKDKLYRCPTSEYPELTEDLVITGCHSILVKSFKNDLEREKTIEVNGNTYVTDRHYRLPACADCRTKIFEEEGVHTIWHFSLENSDYYMNYGVYANGLLVETTSNRMMVELSGMTLHF